MNLIMPIKIDGEDVAYEDSTPDMRLMLWRNLFEEHCKTMKQTIANKTKITDNSDYFLNCFLIDPSEKYLAKFREIVTTQLALFKVTNALNKEFLSLYYDHSFEPNVLRKMYSTQVLILKNHREIKDFVYKTEMYVFNNKIDFPDHLFKVSSS